MIHTEQPISPEIIEAFLLNWNKFPFPVLLIDKRHTIRATNKAGEAIGVRQDRKCYELSGDAKPHKGCKAGLCLSRKTCERDVVYMAATSQLLDTYWFPLDGADGLYIHFGADITEYARPELLLAPHETDQ